MIGYNPAGSQDKSRMYIREIVLSRMGFGFINELIQIRGQSGSGKTSIVRALIGLYKVDDGMIFIHGKDINSYSNIELRNIISYCGQYVFLHNDTVLKNIFYPDCGYDTNRVLPYLRIIWTTMN